MATNVWLQDNSIGKEAREYVEVKEEDTLYIFSNQTFQGKSKFCKSLACCFCTSIVKALLNNQNVAGANQGGLLGTG